PEDPLPVPPLLLLPPPHPMKAKSRHARRATATALSKRPREFPWETVCPAVFNITPSRGVSVTTFSSDVIQDPISNRHSERSPHGSERSTTSAYLPTREDCVWVARRQHGTQEVHSVY